MNEPRAVLSAIVPVEHLDILAGAGSVIAERRPSGQLTYKLRYRVGDAQKVVYLGSDPTRAAAVAEAVEWLQRPAENARKLASLMAELRRTLRDVRRLTKVTTMNHGIAQ